MCITSFAKRNAAASLSTPETIQPASLFQNCVFAQQLLVFVRRLLGAQPLSCTSAVATQRGLVGFIRVVQWRSGPCFSCARLFLLTMFPLTWSESYLQPVLALGLHCCAPFLNTAHAGPLALGTPPPPHPHTGLCKHGDPLFPHFWAFFGTTVFVGG